MRKTLSLPLALCLICAIAPQRAHAQGGYPAAQTVQDPVPYEAFSAAQLDNLLSAVATRLDDQWWDVSVRAVAHYPTVL
jgi:hypothetical protein